MLYGGHRQYKLQEEGKMTEFIGLFPKDLLSIGNNARIQLKGNHTVRCTDVWHMARACTPQNPADCI